MINYKIYGVHQIKMQQHKKKLNNIFHLCVCLLKKKNLIKKISMNNYSLLQYFDLLMRT